MTRRTIKSKIDPQCERPELRSFEGVLLDRVLTQRANLVAAGLTILRGWRIAQQHGERVNTLPLGSFEQWSRRVRDALVWLYPAGDPVLTMAELREVDSRLNILRIMIALWTKHIGVGEGHAKTAKELSEVFEPEWRAMLIENFPAKRPGEIDHSKLAYWLRGNKDRVVDRLKITTNSFGHGTVTKWHLRGV